jgi:hypothetical protein
MLMFWHFGGEFAVLARDRLAKRAIVAAVGAAMLPTLFIGAPGFAGETPTRGGAAPGVEEIDTEDLFGFVGGADIGPAGHQEIEADTILFSGKSSGTYNSTAALFQYKYTAFTNFRVTGAATLAYYNISGVAGLNDLQSAAVQSLSFDARFRLLDRGNAPFGLTLSLSPHWGFADEISGVQLNHFGWQALLLADRELVPNRVVGAFNLLFDTDRTRLLPNHAVEQEPTPGIGSALAMQILPGLWLGGELRYLRSYDGAALETFSGQAIYAGPTLYTRLGKQGWMSAAFNIQAWGRAVGVPSALDLVNFERYQAMLRLGFEF